MKGAGDGDYMKGETVVLNAINSEVFVSGIGKATQCFPHRPDILF